MHIALTQHWKYQLNIWLYLQGDDIILVRTRFRLHQNPWENTTGMCVLNTSTVFLLVCMSSFDSVYPRAGWWFPDHRGPGWRSLHLKMSQISALWYNAAAEPFYCPLLLCHGHRCPDQSEHLGEMRKYLFLCDCWKLEKAKLSVLACSESCWYKHCKRGLKIVLVCTWDVVLQLKLKAFEV